MPSRCAASALPSPAERPWPSDPVATSTHGIRGVGWPSRSLSSLRSVRRSFSLRIPHSAYADHSTGAACPFERTNRSFAGLCGSFGSNCISLKKMTDMRSAADRHDDGWPEPASVVAFSESIRSRLPFSLSASIDVGIFLLYRSARNAIAKHADAFNFDFNDVVGLHGFGIARSAGINNVARSKRH